MSLAYENRPFAPMATPSVVVELAGVPVPKGRPKFGNGHAYTPARTRSYEGDIKYMARLAMRGREIFTGPVKVDVLAALPIPPSWSKVKQARACAGTVRPTGRPDVDNLLKTVGDALNGIVWKDDAQVVIASISKRYSVEPRLRIEVEVAIGEGG